MGSIYFGAEVPLWGLCLRPTVYRINTWTLRVMI